MKKLFFTLLFLLILCLTAHAQNALRLSTYYPAPFGSYDRLRLAPRDPIANEPHCDATLEGLLYYADDPINALNICQQDGTWGFLNGIWTQDASNNVFLSETDSNPNLSVGIGTTNPDEILHIVGDKLLLDDTSAEIIFEDSNDADWKMETMPNDKFQISSGVYSTNTWTERLTMEDNGNVGIGTATPQTQLHLSGNGGVAGEILLENTAAGASTGISLTNPNDTSDFAVKADQDQLGLYTNENRAGWAVRMSVQPNGNVGIGTTAPTAKLDVNGTIRVRTLPGVPNPIVGTMGDVAEYVNVSDGNELELGDVVIIDHKNPRHFTRSIKPHDPLVGGIISDISQAALAIGNEGENKYLLALAGQVQCKVTAENGAIAVGDLLTTSSKPGYAMKATTPISGTILGKALEPLEKDEGKIIILVTLQ